MHSCGNSVMLLYASERAQGDKRSSGLQNWQAGVRSNWLSIHRSSPCAQTLFCNVATLSNQSRASSGVRWSLQVTAPPLEQTQLPHGVAVTSSKHQQGHGRLVRTSCCRKGDQRQQRLTLGVFNTQGDSSRWSTLPRQFPPPSFYSLKHKRHHCSSSSAAKGPRPAEITQILWQLSTWGRA